MKRLYSLFILCGTVLFTYLSVSTKYELDCLIKKYTGICCPGCGLTRAFRCIFNLDFSGAVYYNILSIPLFILIVIFGILLIKDIIRNDNTAISLFNKICKKYYIAIIIILFITMVINNIHGI